MILARMGAYPGHNLRTCMEAATLTGTWAPTLLAWDTMVLSLPQLEYSTSGASFSYLGLG